MYSTSNMNANENQWCNNPIRTKQCSLCKEWKPFDHFHQKKTSTDGYRSECKLCRKGQRKGQWYDQSPEQLERMYEIRDRNKEERRAMIYTEYSKGCADCGELDPVVLEFDHVRGEKKANIANLLCSGGKETLRIELEKCDVVCANCHRRRTAKRRRWVKQRV